MLYRNALVESNQPRWIAIRQRLIQAVSTKAWIYTQESEQQRRHKLAQGQGIRERSFRFEVLGFEQANEDIC
jgi:hypothetical protein